MNPIPVICDRCRAEGLAGEDPFEAFGALLDFDPVPRRTTRADGWDAEVQRAFIAALSLTGSARQAARAVGKAAFGADQLRRVEGNEGFLAAWDEALEIAADERSRRLAEGLRAVAHEQSGWRPPAPPWGHAATRAGGPGPGRRGRPPASLAPPVAEAALDDAEQSAKRHADKLRLFHELVRNYLYRVDEEHKARLAGQIVTADFYLRQLTYIELCFDLFGDGDALKLLMDFRRGGSHLIHIARTPLSQYLEDLRRRYWRSCGEPERPAPPPEDLLVDKGEFCIEPLEYTRGGTSPTHEQQMQAFRDRHARDAQAHVEWLAKAAAEAAAWRTRLQAEEAEAEAARNQGAEEAGQPAPPSEQSGDEE
jgi:hypothetical protein